MPCSHCHLPGHTYLRCPTISDEEKERKKQENRNRRNQLVQRGLQQVHQQQVQQQQVHQQQVQQQQVQQRVQQRVLEVVQRTDLSRYTFHNTNEYPVSLYFTVSGEGDHIFTHLMDIRGGHSSMAKINKPKVRIIIVPWIDYKDSHFINENEMPDKKCIIYDKIMSELGEDVNNIIIPHKEYIPSKTELDKWKEVSLKSYFLLTQIIKLGGKKNENLEPILDMVQDIKIPEHNEIDKERAGVPSTFTNIT